MRDANRSSPRSMVGLAAFNMIVISMILSSCASAAPVAPPTPHAPPTIFSPPSITLIPPAALPGEKVDVGGYELYLYCTGAGSPTVILEAGLGGDATSWTQVQSEVAKFTSACSYDRAGLAHSDHGPTPRDAEMSVNDLQTLLAEAGISPPYLLVGHSFGGLLIRRFAFDYPDEVSGLIFVDSLHEDWWDAALALLPPSSPSDSARLASFRSYLTDGWRDPNSNAEAMDLPAVTEQVRETGDFGDMPITVLTAGVFDALNPGLPADLESALATLFHDDLQGRLAALSTAGAQALIPESGHNMPRENPQAVVDAIRILVMP